VISGWRVIDNGLDFVIQLHDVTVRIWGAWEI